ncbi:MAG TPA: YncE family protein [Ktedonobacteraceae bacterium]|nr:YncE family protein [Ktedonobacteraceae bacterium]
MISLQKLLPYGFRTTMATITLLFISALFPIVAHADGGAPQLAYVAGTPQGISAIDIQQQKVTRTLSVKGDPHTIMLSLDGRYLYVTQPTLGLFTMLSAKTGQTICTANVPGHPTLLTYDTTDNLLFAAANDAASVTEIDGNSCKIVYTFKIGSPIYGLAVANVGSANGTSNQLWVSGTSSVTILDTGKHTQLASFPIAGGPQYITFPPGTEAYITTRQGDVDAVDFSTYQVVTLLTGGKFGPMDFDEITDEVFVPDQLHKQIDVLAPVSSGSSALPKEPSHVYSLGVVPESVAITGDGQLGVVALSSGNVAMIDIPGERIANTFTVGGTPHFIITGLYPPAIGTTPQQSDVWETVATILAYALVIALVLIPIYFFRRSMRKKGQMKKG